MVRYTRKFIPGEHYAIAHDALASKTYGVTTLDEEGRRVGYGTLAQSQVQWFFDNNFSLSGRNFKGCNDFIVSMAQFDNCCDSFAIIKDLWIEEQIDKTFNMIDLFYHNDN